MKKILSVFFNIDRVYLAGLTLDESGVSLDYINSTIHHVDLENINTEESVNGIAELNKFFFEMNFDPDEVSVTLPSESVLVAKFPGKKDMTEDELKRLLNLEISQVYPQCDEEDFSKYVIPLTPNDDKLYQIMSVIVPNEDFNAINQVLQILNRPVFRYDITQLNAHTCFLYNYPEFINKTVLFVFIQGQFMDISVLQNGAPIYFNLTALTDFNQIGEILEHEHAKIVPSYVSEIDACFYFGTGINKQVSLTLWETASLLGIFEAKRLNAFRMLKTSLSKREKEYCSRTFHIFPACVGAALVPQHTILRV
ncbi:hypothetical protein MASR1M45_03780 [Candidatus Kapaibacterium sp.]